ncbi:hypothetical protein [Citrobacter freundii]|uniref:hypothetical protein n=1 Tax=Citrobacter freundii TaxID=546 RepID=UPI0039794D84
MHASMIQSQLKGVDINGAYVLFGFKDKKTGKFFTLDTSSSLTSVRDKAFLLPCIPDGHTVRSAYGDEFGTIVEDLMSDGGFELFFSIRYDSKKLLRS